MKSIASAAVAGTVALALVSSLAACGDGKSAAPAAGGGPAGTPAAAPPMEADGGVIQGRVLGEDGKPIAVAEDIAIDVHGVSKAGERVNYSPGVKPDGTYRQKLVDGTYRIGRSYVKVKFGNDTLMYDLVPQGNLWNKDRDADDGLVQDFVWKITGQRPDSSGDKNNHTHWYGFNISMRPTTWRDDVKKAPTFPPAGTKLVFTLKPLSKSIDGRDLQPITVEREFNGDNMSSDTLHDLVPASYEVTGVAKLPDGTTKPILMQCTGDYPNYKASVKAILGKDGILGGMTIPPVSWVVE